MITLDKQEQGPQTRLIGNFIYGENYYAPGLMKGICLTQDSMNIMIIRVNGKTAFLKTSAIPISRVNMSQKERNFFDKYFEDHPGLEEKMNGERA